MIKYRYKVVFKNEHVLDITVYANNTAEAKILAQAEAIKDGLDYRVDYITRI